MAGIPGLTVQSGSIKPGTTFNTPNVSTGQLQQAFDNGGLTYQSGPAVFSAATKAPGPGQNGYVNPNTTNNTAPGPGQNGYVNPNPQGIDQSQIDAIYNPSYDYLNQAEANVRTDLPNVLSEAQTNYDTNKAQLDSSNQLAGQQFGLLSTEAANKNQDAMSQSRRLYSDLNRGYQQRFGGSSSAGQAASEIANVEQQRQQGQTNRDYQDTTAKIGLQRQQVDSQYQNGILQLAQAKQIAVDQANRDFQAKLLDISKSRADLGVAKGQASLAALQDLRNKVFTINQQNTQFQQTLQAQANQAHLQLQNYQAMVGSGMNTATQYANAYNPNIQSNLQVNGVNNMQQSQQNQYTGQISNSQPDYNRFPNDGFSY